MTFSSKLTPQKERELIVEYEDGWTINELSVIYRVSVRTVYRTLAKYRIPRRDNRRKKFKADRKVKPRVLKPCGSEAAYRRHKRKGEYPCTECLAAHSKDVSDRRGKKK